MTTQIHHINNVYHYRRNLKLHAVLIKQKKTASCKQKKEIFFFSGKKTAWSKKFTTTLSYGPGERAYALSPNLEFFTLVQMQTQVC